MTTRRIYLQMKGIAEARELFFSRLAWESLAASEEIPTLAARGRVTAAPVWARWSSPAVHLAAMDGFAVAAAATFGATPERPRRLALGREAIPVNTGHLMPPGADAVIMVEHVPDPEADPITVEAPVFPWQNVRRVGEDLVAGEMVLPEGVEITPWAQGALLAAGVTRVTVRRRPKVIIIPTGAELVPPEELGGELPEGRLPEFNSVILAGLVEEAGGVPEVWPVVPDDAASLTQTLKRAVAGAEVVIINAGSSAGSEDYTYQAVAALGEVLVHGVAMMPGKPTRPPDCCPLRSASHSPGQNPGSPVAKPAFQARNYGVCEGDARPGGRKGHRHPPAPGRRSREGLEEDRPVYAELLVSPEDLEGTLVVLGSHDNTLDLLATLLRRRDPRLRLSSGHVGSLGGLMALRQGRAHLAGSHLFDPETNTYNIPYLQKYLAEMPLKLINLAWRQQGLMVQPGNPKNIITIRDLTRPEVRFINRQRGAGTRILLDYLLKVEGVAANVKSGTADAGLGILAAARALGLDFVPLTPERYDLVVPEATFHDARFQTLWEVIRSPEFAAAAAALGGYDLRDCGAIVWEQK